MNYLGKPFSPHLSIYKVQDSSLFSILHRFSAIFVAFLFLYFNIVEFMSVNLFYFNAIILSTSAYKLILFVIKLSIGLSIFHVCNGFKIILVKFYYLEDLVLISLKISIIISVLIGLIYI